MNIDRELLRYARSQMSAQTCQETATGCERDYITVRLCDSLTVALIDREKGAGSPDSLDADAEVRMMTSPNGYDTWNGPDATVFIGSARECIDYMANFRHWNHHYFDPEPSSIEQCRHDMGA